MMGKQAIISTTAIISTMASTNSKLMSRTSLHHCLKSSLFMWSTFDINSSSSSLAELATVTDKKVDVLCVSFCSRTIALNVTIFHQLLRSIYNINPAQQCLHKLLLVRACVISHSPWLGLPWKPLCSVKRLLLFFLWADRACILAIKFWKSIGSRVIFISSWRLNFQWNTLVNWISIPGSQKIKMHGRERLSSVGP